MVHLHEVRDTDSHFVIDPITRAITNPNSAKNKLMQGDHNSEIYTFEIPKVVEGHDMTLCNAVRIHYNDISADKANESKDFFPVEDMHIDEVHTDTMVFSWLLSGNATMYAGLLSFRIQFLCINDSGEITYKWHTDIFKGITISDGFDNSDADIESYSDVIARWEAELFGAGDSVMANIESKGSEQIAAIEDAGSVAVSAVEAKGAETLETIPDDYTELYGMAYDAVRTRANAIVENVEGDVIAANDCSGDYLRGLRVFGKSEQLKTTGAQKLPYPYTQTTRTTNGITYTDNGDGSIKISGTATANAYLDLFNKPSLEIEGSHFLSGVVAGLGYKMYAYTGGEYKEDNGNGVLLADGVTSVHILVASGATVNTTVYPMLSEGEAALPWEPYTGGVASPSPEYPQEIHSVENAVVSVHGKNLLKPKAKTETINGVTFVVGEDGSVTANGTAIKATFLGFGPDLSLLPGETYVLSGCPEGGGFDTYMLYLHYKESGLDVYNRTGETKFTAKDEAFSSVVVIYEGVTVSNLVFHPMIRLASYESGDFETYNEQTVTIPNTLHGIPVSSGGNYTDANGQQWICDEVDLARGVYVQRVATVTFSGEEDWYLSATQIDAGTRFDCNISTAPVALVSESMCNRFQYRGANAAVETAWILEESQGFRIITEKASTVAELKAFLAANPTTMIYAMYKPVETTLTDEEIFNFSQIHSNYPNTTVLNDAGAWMEVAYNADTQLYFNNSRGASDEQVEKSVDTWLTEHFPDAEGVSF